MEDWDTDDEGNLKVHNFHGYESATAPGHVLLRTLFFSDNPDLPLNTPDGFQVAMTPHMARKLAADLLANADKAEQD